MRKKKLSCKMKKIVATFGKWIALAIMFEPFTALGGIGYTNPKYLDDDFAYELESGSYNVCVTRLKHPSDQISISIPGTVVLQREVWEGESLWDAELIGTNYQTCTVTRIDLQSYSDLVSVTIPNSVTDVRIYNCCGLTRVTMPNGVTNICLSRCSSLTSVMIPSSVTSIGDYAFERCSGLTSVTIPESVTSIGNSAFSGCSSLTSVTIPSSVTSIGDLAFSECSSLASMTIPQCGIAEPLYSRRFYCSAGGVPIRHLALDVTVSAIHENAFYNCKLLTTIEVAAENVNYFVSPTDSCLYDSSGTTLLCCPRDKENISIPYGVTRIANYAFAYCSNIVSVTIPNTLKQIGEYAFYDCTSLPTVTIPNSVTNIGIYAFGNCRNLRGVTIPIGVKALSTTAFDGCDILWTEWYRALANLAVNGFENVEIVDPHYALVTNPMDRSIANVSVDADTVLDAFVLKDGKVYDSVLYIKNNANHAVKVTLPSGHTYQTFKGATPLTLPAYSTSILTITRVAGDNAGGNVFLVTREELETVQ